MFAFLTSLLNKSFIYQSTIIRQCLLSTNILITILAQTLNWLMSIWKGVHFFYNSCECVITCGMESYLYMSHHIMYGCEIICVKYVFLMSECINVIRLKCKPLLSTNKGRRQWLLNIKLYIYTYMYKTAKNQCIYIKDI